MLLSLRSQFLVCITFSKRKRSKSEFFLTRVQPLT